MRRNWNTIRTILLAVESGRELSDCNPEDDGFTGRSVTNFINEHVALLVQAKLLNGMAINNFEGTVYQNLALTWSGHDFLDLARNEERWNEAMAIVEEKQGISFDMLAGLLKSLASRTVLR